MGAKFQAAGMCAAKLGVEQRSTQCLQHFVDHYFLCRKGQYITTTVAGRTIYKPGKAEYPGEFGNIVNGYSLCLTKLRNAHTFTVFASCNAKQYSQTIFFLCSDFHFSSFSL